ncbi:Oxysterol-binding protein-domain-containing protein [Mycena leptocephala]|nr:Oxysterol-binding protein-domain-containing protein [Mycena leptocephala]
MASSRSSSSLKKSTTSTSTSGSSLNIPDASGGSMGAEPLYQVKLLSALRNGDPALIHPFLAEIGKEKRKSSDLRAGATGSTNGSKDSGASDIDTGAAALHLAIRCASLETVTLLLSHRAISPNGIHPPGSGTTPLHLAASLGRADIVNLLLEQEAIDDTLVDREGCTAREVARGKDVVRVIDDSRAFLNASYRSLLRSYILSPFPASTASTGGGNANANANYTNNRPGSSGPHSPQMQLQPQGHGAAYQAGLAGQPPPALLALLSSPRAKYVDLAYLDDASGRALLHEAARRRDLRLLELAVRAGADVFGGGDGEVKAFLRQLTNQDAALLHPPSPPTANAAAPVLRGYLNKYTNVAKGWNTRWFVLKEGVLSYYRHQDDEAFASRGSMAVKNCVLKPPAGAEGMRFEIHSGAAGRGGEKWYMKANHPVEAGRWVAAISANVAWAKAREGDNADDVEGRGSTASGAASIHGGNASGAASITSNSSTHPSGGRRERLVSVLRKSTTGSISGSARHGGSVSMTTMPSDVDSEYNSGGGPGADSGEASPKMGESDADPDVDNMDADAEDDEEDEGFDDSSASASGSIHTGRVTAPHEATFQLLGNSAIAQLELTQGLVGTSSGGPADALRDALQMVSEYVAVARERDAWWRRKLGRARAKQSAWERSLASAVREGEVLERELRLRSRKRGSRFFDSGEAAVALAGEAEPTPTRSGSVSATPAPPVSPPVRSATADTLAPPTATASTFGGRSYMNYGDTESLIDTDEEDEFYDAIESNTIPNLLVHDALKSPTHSELALPDTVNVEPYAGYQKLRQELLLSDARPSTSLWSVLKHSIGKDLTKISFPMLQRMILAATDAAVVDVAAKERDAHRRIAFVAAFAMSNYSSTIGRIAKPFNPMLVNETFEYVRIDKEYRYLSEQVSHHPPISACMAESPYWRYFGEVRDAQNKFMGKSFEIRPTGVAHAELLLPAEFAPSYPRATGPFEGKVREHYSWKKVTTNVSGFILGSPTIDHYGDMVITNHRTKDTCVLTFKPRGWRGKDAYEISGRVMDANGRVSYEISGRWNSQLIARQIGAGSTPLNPDLRVSGLNSPSATPEYILLWRNSEKPEGSPFNLTPFAISLNDCPKDTLKPYLCPTDCRLRPDQRAFEMGKYEIANTLKNDQEEKQRATRKLRDQGELPPHKPRWFTAETDGDTGERVWTPSRLEDGGMEYWAERERIWKMGGNQPWTDVAPIFIDEPDFIR